jgi:glycosyltransferase involved in cell wall biosynthesis
MTRVAFISVVPSPYQRDLFGALAAREDVRLRVFYMEKSAPDSPWPDKPLEDYESYLPGFWFPLGRARVHLNWRLPRPEDYDVVVCNTLMSLTGQWLMRTKLRGTRWMFWGEKLGPRSWRHDLLTAPLRKASGIAAIGSWAERDYVARFPAVPVSNIPYHCALAPFLAVKRASEFDATTFLFCGQMIERKGLDTLLAAFAKLPTNARLLLVGREAELPALLSKLPAAVRSRVRYAGFQAPDALPGFFAQADVFVLPSRYDGWGVVVNQALGAGLPILVSDQVGAGYDLVRPGENGFTFSAGNVTDLSEKMRPFIDDRDLGPRMGAASRRRAADWTPERGAEKWAYVLKSILK